MQYSSYKTRLWIVTGIIGILAVVNICMMNGRWYEFVAIRGNEQVVFSLKDMLRDMNLLDVFLFFTDSLVLLAILIVLLTSLAVTVAMSIFCNKAAAVGSVIFAGLFLLISYRCISVNYSRAARTLAENNMQIISAFSRWAEDHAEYEINLRPTVEYYGGMICPALILAVSIVRCVMVWKYKKICRMEYAYPRR